MLATPVSQMKMMQTKLAGSLESLEHIKPDNNGNIPTEAWFLVVRIYPGVWFLVVRIYPGVWL